MRVYNFSQKELERLRQIEKEESEKSYVGSPGTPDVLGKAWKDEEITQILTHEIVHMSDDKNDFMFCKWLKAGTTSVHSIRAYLALTVYVGTQIRDPDTRAYVFKGTEVPDDQVGKKSEIRDDNRSLLPILNSYNMLLSGDAASEQGISNILEGTNPLLRSLVVPAYALFVLRVVFRTSFNINDDNILSGLANQIAVFYRIDQAKTITPAFPTDIQMQLMNHSFIGTPIVNTALVNALRYSTEETSSNDMRSILNYCFLLHAKWNGMASISRLLTICKREERPPQFLIELSRVLETAPYLNKILKFIEDHMNAASPSKYAPWCRALSNQYETGISNSNQLFIIAIWTLIIDPSQTAPIWRSQVLKNLSASSWEAAIKIAHFTKLKLEGDDKNLHVSRAKEERGLSAQEILRQFSTMNIGSAQNQHSAGTIPETVLKLSGRGAGIGST